MPESNSSSSRPKKTKTASTSWTVVFFQICLVGCFFISQYNQLLNLPTSTAQRFGVSYAVAPRIIEHTTNFIGIGDSDSNYEPSKARLREYVRDYLVEAGNFTTQQIVWHRFEWNEKKAQGREIVTTTWTGINILIWSNSTYNPNNKHKVRVFGAHYDSQSWGSNNTRGAYNNFSGAATLLELAIAVRKFQEMYNSEEDVPYLFVLFDHTTSGCLGSKTFIDYYKLDKERDKIAYFVYVDSVGLRGSIPFLQTFPYEHAGKTKFSPKWLSRLFIQSTTPVTSGFLNTTTFTLGIGHSSSLISSILYQVTRYHLISVRYLNDEGPFIWKDIPSLHFTDFYNFIFKVEYNADRDLPTVLDPQLLFIETNLLLQFALITQHPDVNTMFLTTSASSNHHLKTHGVTDIPLEVLESLAKAIFQNSYDQYVVFGNFSFGFVDCLCISLSLLLLVYNTTFNEIRAVTKRVVHGTKAGNGSVKLGKVTVTLKSHVIMFVHILLVLVALLLDTVFASLMVTFGFLAVLCAPITTYYIGLLASWVGGMMCAGVLTFDLFVIRAYGERASALKELHMGFLVFVYAFHCICVFGYAMDFYLKKQLLKKKHQ